MKKIMKKNKKEKPKPLIESTTSLFFDCTSCSNSFTFIPPVSYTLLLRVVSYIPANNTHNKYTTKRRQRQKRPGILSFWRLYRFEGVSSDTLYIFALSLQVIRYTIKKEEMNQNACKGIFERKREQN